MELLKRLNENELKLTYEQKLSKKFFKKQIRYLKTTTHLILFFQESLWHTWIAYTEGDLKVFWIVLTLSTHGL